MTSIRTLIFLATTLMLGMPVFAQGKSQARLLLNAETARPGETIIAAIELRMPAGWHTYWRFAGDSGLPTTVEWQLPPGITAGEILWPVPEKYVSSGLTTYVYHDVVLLLVPLQLGNQLQAGPVELKAKASWLECEKICLPGSAQIQAALKIDNESKLSENAPLIEAWQKKLPQKTPPFSVQARWESESNADTRPVLIELASTSKAGDYDFFPYGGPSFEVSGDTEALDVQGKPALRKQVRKLESAWPDKLQGLIVAKTAKENPPAYEVTLALGSKPAGASVNNAAGPSPASAISAPGKSLGLMLLFAFLGGLILNVMPCVLPVIALKILGFVNESRNEPHRVRKLGLVYGSGVIVSFLTLAGLIIAVQQAGRAASWGMQFQNPQFLVGMTVLVTLVALNLFGVFEVTLGGAAMGAAGTLAAREGSAGAFFNGVLATALATPCTAPFLAPALGFALAQPPAIILLFFFTIGLGLALPYVVLSWIPAWLRFLPKPGAWMEKFKIIMGFPMLATAFWLFSLTASHYGKKGTLWFGLFLVTLALAVWIWGQFVQHGTRHRLLARVLSVLVLLLGYFFTLEKELRWRAPVAEAAVRGNLKESPDGIDWEPWSREAVQAARAAGRPVLVDFTADWCLTCQLNKRTSIEVPDVRKKLKELNAVALLGDYTRFDPAITEELKRFQRAGVPLVVVFPADPSGEPIVLPEALLPGIVLNALEKAAAPQVAARNKTGSG